MNETIAERKMIFENKNGERKPITIRIGKPYPISDSEWACPVALDGLYKSLADQHGVDSLQSLNLAIRLAQQLLSYLEEEGGHFFFEEGAGPIAVSEIFK
jgi:hypothetical protein